MQCTLVHFRALSVWNGASLRTLTSNASNANFVTPICDRTCRWATQSRSVQIQNAHRMCRSICFAITACAIHSRYDDLERPFQSRARCSSNQRNIPTHLVSLYHRSAVAAQALPNVQRTQALAGEQHHGDLSCEAEAERALIALQTAVDDERDKMRKLSGQALTTSSVPASRRSSSAARRNHRREQLKVARIEAAEAQIECAAC